MLDTPTPSYVDIAVYTPIAFARSMTKGDNLFEVDKFPNTISVINFSRVADSHLTRRFKWLQRLKEYIAQAKEKTRVELIDGKTAADLIVNGTQAPLDTSCEKELDRMGIHIGDSVICMPDDTG